MSAAAPPDLDDPEALAAWIASRRPEWRLGPARLDIASDAPGRPRAIASGFETLGDGQALALRAASMRASAQMLAIGFLSCAWLVAGLAAIPWAWGVSRGAIGSQGLARSLPILALLWGAAPIALPWARRRMRRLSLISVGLDLQREAASRRVQALGVAREIGRAAPEPPGHKPPGAGKPRL